jgi:hypothetical protein
MFDGRSDSSLLPCLHDLRCHVTVRLRYAIMIEYFPNTRHSEEECVRINARPEMTYSMVPG